MIIEQLRPIIGSFLKEKGYELIDLTFRKEFGSMNLKVLTDRPDGGITLEECGRLSETIGDIVDNSGVITTSYVLEVASPGLDRPIVSDRDYERVLGRLIKVYVAKPLEKKSVVTGKLVKFEQDKIILDKNGEQFEIPRSLIAKAVLEIEF